MRKHSPGPWRRDSARFDDLVDANGERVVFGRLVLGAGYQGDREEQIQANTNLAEAAPDLLSALDRLVGCVKSIGRHPVRDLDEAMEEARAVIAKAEGR